MHTYPNINTLHQSEKNYLLIRQWSLLVFTTIAMKEACLGNTHKVHRVIRIGIHCCPNMFCYQYQMFYQKTHNSDLINNSLSGLLSAP